MILGIGSSKITKELVCAHINLFYVKNKKKSMFRLCTKNIYCLHDFFPFTEHF